MGRKSICFDLVITLMLLTVIADFNISLKVSENGGRKIYFVERLSMKISTDFMQLH